LLLKKFSVGEFTRPRLNWLHSPRVRLSRIVQQPHKHNILLTENDL